MSESKVLPGDSVDEFEILFTGYVPQPFPDPIPWGATADVAPTVAFLRDGDRTIVYDPGTVPGASSILDPLNELGYGADDITDVIISHHHPDHARNVALFPRATLQDVWGSYRGDKWTLRQTAEGFDLTPGIRLLATPGHTESDISTLVATPEGLVVFTHLWWNEAAPTPDDPLALDQAAFHRNRERILSMRPRLIVPGHGAPFVPGEDVPQ